MTFLHLRSTTQFDLLPNEKCIWKYSPVSALRQLLWFFRRLHVTGWPLYLSLSFLISIKKTDGGVEEPQWRAFIIQQLFPRSNIKSYFETVKVCKIITVSLSRPNGESPWRGDNLSYSHPPGACACQQKIRILVIGRLTFLQSQVRMYVRGERSLPETLWNAAFLVPRRLKQMHFNSSTLRLLVQRTKSVWKQGMMNKALFSRDK